MRTKFFLAITIAASTFGFLAQPAVAQKILCGSLDFTTEGAMCGSGQTISKKKIVLKFEAAHDAENAFAGYKYSGGDLGQLSAGDRIGLFIRDLAAPAPAGFTGGYVRGRKVRGGWQEVTIQSVNRSGETVAVEFREEVELWNGLTTRRVEYTRAGNYWVEAVPPADPQATASAVLAVLKDQKKLPATRARAAEAVGELGLTSKDALEGLAQALNDADAQVRLAAAKALETVAPRAEEVLPVLVGGLSNADVNVRIACVKALGSLASPPPEAVRALTAALKDPDRYVRERAAMVLKRLGPAAKEATPLVIEALIQALRSDPRAYQVGAVAALGEYGAEARAAMPVLKGILNQGEPLTRGYAAQALWRIDPTTAPEIVPVLATMLSGRDNVKWAAETLGEIGPAAKDAIPALTRLANEKRQLEEIRRATAEALKKIQPQ